MNDVDLVWIPRVNTIEGMEQSAHKKMGMESYRKELGKLS